MPGRGDPPEATSLEAEALRVYRRYQQEFVEGLGLCPWAERARREGRVRERVMFDASADPAGGLEAVRVLAADPGIEIGLLIYPLLDRLDRPEFERFVSSIRAADEASAPEGGVIMALAAFHPRAATDASAPARLVPMIRRSPDPTIQLVRRAALDRVRGNARGGTGYVNPAHLDYDALLAERSTPPLHERVAEANLERVRAFGFARAEALLDEIRRDRDRAYGALESGGEGGSVLRREASA